MGLRPGYKRTMVGIIPSDWDASTVGQQFSVQLGKMLNAKTNVGVVKPYLGNRAVQWNRIDIGDLPSVKLTPSDLTRFRLEKDDLLVCEGGEVGRAAIWEAPIDECYYQKALHRLRPLKGYDPRFMLAVLRRWADKGMLTNYVTQTSIAHLPRDRFIEIPIPLPSMAEQSTIAVALSDVDALLKGLDRLIVKKQDLKQAVMQQLLTGRTRLPGFDGEWGVNRLGDVAEIVMGQSPSSAYYNIRSEGLPLIQGNADASNRKTVARVFTTHVTKRAHAGDILMSVRAPVGEIFQATFDACLGRGVCAIRFPNDFLYHLLVFLEPSWAKHSKGSTFDSVSASDIKAIEFEFPTDVDEQTAIASVLSDMDAEIAALKARRDKTRDLKQAMMHELLTGKTRLIKPQTVHA